MPTIGIAGLAYTTEFSKLRRFTEDITHCKPTQGPPYIHNPHLAHDQFVGQEKIGLIKYKNGTTAEIAIPNNPGFTDAFHILAPQAVKGFSINSMRPLFKYKPVSFIPIMYH